MKTPTFFPATLILFVLCFKVAIPSFAVTYYISATGNDSLAGSSIAEAWQTISRINEMDLSAGDSILFEGGKLFDGQIVLDSNDGNDAQNPLIISSFGNGKAIINAGDEIALLALNVQGIHISQLIFSGSGMTTNTFDGIRFFNDLDQDTKLNNIKIEEVEVMGFGERGISVGSWNGLSGYENVMIRNSYVHHCRRTGIEVFGFYDQQVSGWAHRNISIQHCQVHNISGYSATSHRGSGIILAQTEDGLIENCTAYDNGYDNTSSAGPGGIWAWDCNHITIQYCESYRNHTSGPHDGLGFDFDGGVQNSIMQFNYAHDNDGAGFLLGQFPYARDWYNNIVRYNISENNGRKNSAEISLFMAPNTNMKNTRIYGNTIYTTESSANPDLAAFNFIEWSPGILGVEVLNNIFVTHHGVPLIDIPVGYEAYFAGNLYWASGDTLTIRDKNIEYHDLQSWRTESLNEVFNGVTTGTVADPLFEPVNESENIPENAFLLSMNSPAINAGINIDPVYDFETSVNDYWNNHVPQGAGFDIGANEAILNTSPTTGLNNSETPLASRILTYPNPAAKGESITVTGFSTDSEVEILDMNGTLIESSSSIAPEITLSTTGWSPGIYILKIIHKKSNKIQFKKIVLK